MYAAPDQPAQQNTFLSARILVLFSVMIFGDIKFMNEEHLRVDGSRGEGVRSWSFEKYVQCTVISTPGRRLYAFGAAFACSTSPPLHLVAFRWRNA